MTKTLIFSLALGTMFSLAACGSDALGTDDQGVSLDMTGTAGDMAGRDFAVKPSGDMAYHLRQDGGPLLCGANACSGTDKCCISTQVDGGNAGATSCEATCPSGDIQVDCRGPSQCGGNPCCVGIGASGSASNVTCTSSLSDCKPTIDIGTKRGTTRLCEIDADCSAGAPGSQLPDCCTGMVMGQTQHICFNKAYLAFIPGIPITCP